MIEQASTTSLATKLFFCHHNQSCQYPEMGLEMNLVNLMDVLQKVTEVDSLGLHLGVPKHELDKFRLDSPTIEERKMAMFNWWLNHDPNPTWERVITALIAMHKPVLASAVAEVFKRQSLYDSREEDLQRWENNIKTIDKFEEKLEEVQQRSKHLEKEWEKGEKEWRDYLEKLQKIEQDWEDLVRTQQTERAILTLGISMFWQSNSEAESMQRYSVLEYKTQHHVGRSKELREFYTRAMQHRDGLQGTDTELNAWENKLNEQVSELQERIEQMEELGVKFSGEAKDCRKRLEKSRERLQTCREKMSECRDELTKSRRQLRKCREKLTECDVSLKSCRDELGENHSQITKCINGLRQKSKDLSDQIKALTVVAGGATGAGVGTAGGATIGALIGTAVFPVVGTAIGAGVGAGIGVLVGAGGGLIGGAAVAIHRKKQVEEARQNLDRCEMELADCGNVVERCKEALRRSEDELKELKRVVDGLELCFCLDDLDISTTMSSQKGRYI